ncbi:MAG: hypothetical protein JRN66_07015 [Nitrososphaerota archaeon]|nr:hypothetical protein [Nitrososphaerota archaeon]
MAFVSSPDAIAIWNGVSFSMAAITGAGSVSETVSPFTLDVAVTMRNDRLREAFMSGTWAPRRSMRPLDMLWMG